jgi:hypothetical protein
VVIVLMQRAEHDQQINRIDAARYRKARRASFIAVTACAWFTAIALGTDDALFLFFLLMLVLSTIALMMVDIFALDHRPPHNGHRPAENYAFAGHLAPLRRLISILRRHP